MKKNWRYWLSFLWPLRKSYSSELSGRLELNYIDGQVMLDSPEANYSFGSLQEILERGLEHIDLTSVQRVLLLGLGGGSVVESLRTKFDFQGEIDAVELDPVAIAIACREFGICADSRLKIHQADALAFMQQNSMTYDLVICDLFIDRNIPAQFLTADWAQLLIKGLSNQGQILINLGIQLMPEAAEYEFYHALQAAGDLHWTRMEKVKETNTLVIGKKQ
ncbi:spermidine synthase [Croceimicrobium sp.]|uniref:spermidine synthase n=1 Tax=Croceimicrobium sp. TaxID=2828340 RepID=UPI003BAD1E28